MTLAEIWEKAEAYYTDHPLLNVHVRSDVAPAKITGGNPYVASCELMEDNLWRLSLWMGQLERSRNTDKDAGMICERLETDIQALKNAEIEAALNKLEL